MRISSALLPQLTAHFSDGTRLVLCSGPPPEPRRAVCARLKTCNQLHVTPLDTTVDMRDPELPLVERLVGQVLLQGPLRTTGLLRRHEDLHLREREGQEAQILHQPTASRERVGCGLRNAQIMGTAAVGVAQKEDDEQGID